MQMVVAEQVVEPGLKGLIDAQIDLDIDWTTFDEIRITEAEHVGMRYRLRHLPVWIEQDGESRITDRLAICFRPHMLQLDVMAALR